MNRDLEAFQLAALAAFSLLFITRTVQLRLTHGVQVVTLMRGKPWREAALELLFLVAFPLWLLEISWHGILALTRPTASAWGQWFDPGWLRWPAAGLETAALLLFGAALLSFGRSWRVGVDRRRPGELITRGVFALSRNPIFLAMDLFFVGAVLMTGRIVPTVFALGALLGFHRQILVEERFLRRQYGDAYRDYTARVDRYVGRGNSDRELERETA